MPCCSVCGWEVSENQLLRCHECGKAYCPECAERDPTIKELGVCPDCEEVYEAEEDYRGWGGRSNRLRRRYCFNVVKIIIHGKSPEGGIDGSRASF